MEKLITNKNGNIVQQFIYGPGIAGDSFQTLVSEVMHQIVMIRAEFTLAELGYLHINSLSYDPNTRSLHLRIYFDASCASRTHKSKTKKGFTIEPITELNVFRNFFFVGELEDVVSYEKITAPRYEIIEKDELGRRSVKFKNTKKFDKVQALVLNCNLALTAAACHDINLMDPEFRVSCQTVGKSSKKNAKAVVTSIDKEELPVIMTVSCGTIDPGSSDNAYYDPDEAEAYLIMIQERMNSANGNQTKLQKKVRDKVKVSDKKGKKSGSNGFNKYS